MQNFRLFCKVFSKFWQIILAKRSSPVGIIWYSLLLLHMIHPHIVMLTESPAEALCMQYGLYKLYLVGRGTECSLNLTRNGCDVSAQFLEFFDFSQRLCFDQSLLTLHQHLVWELFVTSVWRASLTEVLFLVPVRSNLQNVCLVVVRYRALSHWCLVPLCAYFLYENSCRPRLLLYLRFNQKISLLHPTFLWLCNAHVVAFLWTFYSNDQCSTVFN